MKTYKTAAHNPNSGLSDERRARELKAFNEKRLRKSRAVAELRRLGQLRKSLFEDRENGWLTFEEYQRQDGKLVEKMNQLRRQNGIN